MSYFDLFACFNFSINVKGSFLPSLSPPSYRVIDQQGGSIAGL